MTEKVKLISTPFSFELEELQNTIFDLTLQKIDKAIIENNLIGENLDITFNEKEIIIKKL